MNNIKLLRIKHGMKQSELAFKLGISQGALSGWETGKYGIDNDSILRLCTIFDVTADYLLGRDEKPKEKPAETINLDGLSDVQRANFELLKRLSPEESAKIQGYIQALLDARKG